MVELRTSFHPDFDPIVGTFHETFKIELNDQLFAKGMQTGIKSFEKHGFFFLVGLSPVNLEKRGELMFAQISFGMQPAFTFDSWISWKSKGGNPTPLEELHTTEVNSETIEFFWDLERFPLEIILTDIKPAKRTKCPKNKLAFDVDYYHNALPDLEINLFSRSINVDLGNSLKAIIKDFDKQLKIDRKFQAISEPLLTNEHVQFILDIGRSNNVRVVNQLLASISAGVGDSITLVEIR